MTRGAVVLPGALLVMAGATRAQTAAPTTPWRDVTISLAASDGTPLEGKLSLPADARGRVPVVFYLHGAGPRTVDHAVRFRDATGQVRITRYYDYTARELVARGIGFFRVAKRGVTADSSGRPIIERGIFSQATATVLLHDYSRALEVLRRRPEVDPARIVLYGSSEGTHLAPRLARREPDGIVGLVLTAYAADNNRRTVEWQNTVGPWRNVMAMIPAASDGRLTRAEWDSAVVRDPNLGATLPFGAIDPDSNGVVDSIEFARVIRPRLDAIVRAVNDHDDDFLWRNLLNLTSAYLLDGWDGPPTWEYLLRLHVPIAILHGELDASTRVEGVLEADSVFKARGRTNLAIHIYPGLGHDLGWTPAIANTSGPEPFQRSFDIAAAMLGVSPRSLRP